MSADASPRTSLAESEAHLREALAQRPGDATVLEQLGIVRFQLADPVAAESLLRQAIEAHPARVSAWNNLAVILEAAGRFREAEECYRRAIELTPQQGLLHFNRANTLRSLGRWEEAEASFRRCIELAPDHADARHNLGALLKERGQRTEAETLFRETIALAPGFVDAHVNLGSTLQMLGRDEEALASYRAALDLAPGYADAVAGEAGVLDRLGRVDEACARIRVASAAAPDNADVVITFASLASRLGAEDEAISALRRLLERNDLLASKREAALFAFGKLLDRAGQHAEAFTVFEAANRVRRRQFDCAGFAARGAQVRETFSAEILSRLPRSRNTSPVPVFVVGMPRSGTSLVEQILASHPAVFGAGELPWVDEFAEQLPQRLASNDAFPRCVLDLTVRALDSAAEQYLALLRRDAPAAERIVDKMPGNFLHLGLIELLFPAARIIHIAREPLDNCLSCYFQNFTHGHEYSGDLAALGAVYREYERTMAHWRATLRLPLLELRYEELVAEQERESRRLVEFCGLAWDERCLRFQETKRVVKTASYEQVRRPMYRDSLARHRHYEPFLAPLRRALSAEE